MNRTGVSVGYIVATLSAIGIVALLTACAEDSGGSSAEDEGTPSAPVTLIVGTPRTGSIGDFGTSFYRFTVTTAATHRISLTNARSDLSWTLFSDPNFTVLIIDCDNYDTSESEVCTTPTALTSGSTYYLSVDEFDNKGGTFTLRVDAL